MAFDLSTAQEEKQVLSKPKFDISTAEPTKEISGSSGDIPDARTLLERFLAEDKERTLFGLPKSKEEIIFPEASKGPKVITTPKETIQQGTKAALEGISLPGRVISSIPTLLPGGEKFSEAIKRKEAPEGAGIIRTLAEDIARDPATMLLTLATGGTGTAAKKPIERGALELLKRITASGVETGVREGVPIAVTQQLDRFANRGDVSITDGLKQIGAAGLMAGGGRVVQEVAGKFLNSAGKKILTTAIKPSKKLQEKFSIDNLVKYGLDGPLDKAVAKADDKITELSVLLKEELKKDPGAKINLVDALGNAEKYLIGTSEAKAAKGGKLRDVQKAISNFLSEVELIAPDGEMNLLDANVYKRAIGKMGAWNIINPDTKIIAQKEVANAFYHSIREAIEKAAPSGDRIQQINRQLSELIPIERALVDRIPVAKNNQLFSLSDVTSIGAGAIAGPKAWALPVINKLSKSPRFGSYAVRKGKKLLQEEPTALDILSRQVLRQPIKPGEEFGQLQE